MKVLITGSSGLIGRWVGQLYDSTGISWAGFDRKPILSGQGSEVHYEADLLDADALKLAVAEYAPTHIVHLAARCDLNGKELVDYDANITGVRNLCSAIREVATVKRVVYTSSQLVCKVGHVPMSDTEYCPSTVYGESKVRTEEIVREENGGGVTWCLARPTTVWGPHMSEHYQSVLAHVKKGTYFHSGGGELFKSYAYAENIAYQYNQLLMAPEAQIDKKVFYMADYEPLSLRKYVNELADAMGVRRPITVPYRLAKLLAVTGDALNALGVNFPYNSFRLKNIRTEYIFDLSATKAVCGALPKTFEDGIQETAHWYLEKHV